MSNYTIKDHSQMIKRQVEFIMQFAKHPVEIAHITHVGMYVDSHGEYHLDISFTEYPRIVSEAPTREQDHE